MHINSVALRPATTRSSVAAGSNPVLWLAVALLLAATTLFAPSAFAADDPWEAPTEQMVEKLEQIPGQYAAADQTGVETSIRQAYYEVYQVTGLESEIDHRLGDERNDAFVADLLHIRELTRDGAPQADVDDAVAAVVTDLQTNVTELATAPEITDKWSRVAERAIDALESAKTAYAAGDYQVAANGARDAYLAHYEADGLEKASISYLGQERVSQLESMFTQLRQEGRDGQVSVADFDKAADELIAALQQDATELDELTSTGDMGWSGFWAAFAVLLREGAEALLVVAALVTYAKKAGRTDQVKGILLGVAAAIVAAIAMAFGFSRLAASAAAGLGQELVEGVTGLLAAVMLIWVSNWILSKSTGKRWEQYLQQMTGKATAQGGTFALASVAFLAVLREGAETILFFSPILAATKTSADSLRIWLGVGAATAVLAVMFTLVWAFGVRLPMKAFFRWTSALLAILAVTITGGAIKEFQDATLIAATQVSGVPTITLLGVYPTVQTLLAQLGVIVILVALAIWQYRQSRDPKALQSQASTEGKQ